MDQNFWLGRWERGEIGWHQNEVEPALIAHFSDLKRSRVFVPLCGKSLDLHWLASRGHEVIGVELSEKAIRDCFTENALAYDVSQSGELKRFQAGNITVWNGDFFALTPEVLGQIDAVYDRAALIALPPAMRAQYAARMKYLLANCSNKKSLRFLQIVLERTPHDELGPPHSVLREELEKLYGDTFRLSFESREEVMRTTAPGAKTEECVYTLNPK